MKRFIDIGAQTGNVEQGEREFAFFDTIDNIFESHSGSMTWDSAEDFLEDFEGANIDRYIKLIPRRFYKN